AEAARLRIDIECNQRVVGLRTSVERGLPPSPSLRRTGQPARRDPFTIEIEGGQSRTARAVVLATGGRSLPKTGSDGFGYTLAQGLAHGYVETTPALAPLVLGDEWPAALSGVSHEVRLTLTCDSRAVVHLEGSLLWTHFGASGPVVLNLSRHWHRARID